MTTSAPATHDDPRRSIDEAALRAKAVKRSWICPGAGFALVGGRALAITTFLVSLGIAPAAAWLAFRPSAASLWATIAVFALATIFWLAEQVAIKKSALRPPGPALLDRGLIAATCLMWLAAILFLGLLVTAFGTLQMAGSGMAPTLEKGERLIYHKHLDRNSIRPGAIIVYRNADDSAWGEPGWIVTARILAGPGDRIAIQNGRYLLNGSPGPPAPDPGTDHVVLAIPSWPESLTVPADCYFIVQDSPTASFDSRILSWARTDKILSTRLWHVRRGGVLKPVK